MAPHGVGVSVLCPGLVSTNLVRNSADNHEDADSTSMAGGLDPAIVGRQVLDAVRADELYIITHSDTRLMVSDRVDQLLAAFDSAPRFEQA